MFRAALRDHFAIAIRHQFGELTVGETATPAKRSVPSGM
jgi:hypothetical protein